jgi:hypothetical protein
MTRLLITLASALLPPSRREWGQAMKAEYDALPEGRGTFAWGCLGASLKENVTTGEGWARLGLGVALAAIVPELATHFVWLRTIIEFNKVAEWHHVLAQIGWFFGPIWNIGNTLFAMILIGMACRTTLDLEAVGKLGASLFALNLVTPCGDIVTTKTVYAAFELSKKLPIDWSNALEEAPIVLIALGVAAYGWRGPKQLAIASLCATISIAVFQVSTPDVTAIVYYDVTQPGVEETWHHPLWINLFIWGFVSAAVMEITQRVLKPRAVA